MRLILDTGPAVEPVTLDEVKASLKIDDSDENALLTALITAARERVEASCRRAVITQAWDFILDEAPAEIVIPLPPLQVVNGITVIAEDGTETTVDEDIYVVDAGGSQPGRVRLKPGCSWPDHRGFASFVVNFDAGYGDAAADVPAPIRQAMLVIVAHMFENRGDAKAAEEMPALAAVLLQPYRIFNL